MTRASLEAVIAIDDGLLIDSSALIAHFKRDEAVSPVAAHIIDEMVRSGRNPSMVSMVTAMEVLVHAFRHGSVPAELQTLDFLTAFPHLQAVPVDLAVAREAAVLRGRYRFAAPDALIIATGMVHEARHLVTNDAAWSTKLAPIGSRIEVCHLASHLPFP